MPAWLVIPFNALSWVLTELITDQAPIWDAYPKQQGPSFAAGLTDVSGLSQSIVPANTENVAILVLS